MKKTLFPLALCLVVLFGCIGGPGPGGENQTNATNTTAPPGGMNTTPPPQIPPGYEVRNFCKKDSDCLRQKKCCDCGLGEYVNAYNLDKPQCQGPSCACPTRLSMGICQDNKCVAAPYEEAPVVANESHGEFYFRTGETECGNEQWPQRVTGNGLITLYGYVGTPTPCFTTNGSMVKVNATYYIVNVTTEQVKSRYACAQCSGATPWFAEIRNFTGQLEVYYNGTLVYSELYPFCGWSKGLCQYDSDCAASGCFGEVCGSRRDPPVTTNCDDWRYCYDAGAYGAKCGCENYSCVWK